LAIVVLKLVHSAIFLVNSASVLHIFWVGVSDRRSRWTGLALTAALTESLVFVANRGRCPLTAMVEQLGAESGRVSDIFLPRWFADRIPVIFGPVGRQNLTRAQISVADGVLELLWLLVTTVQAVACPHQNLVLDNLL